MRNSSLLKWAQNNKNMNKMASSVKGKDDKGGNNSKNWIHDPESLQKGHVAYLVKFLGCTEVDKPKGIDVVKQGIQKLKFNQQLKKSEGSTKTPKVELTISVEGVAIQEPKTKKILHQYPLHKISYCADDKAEKRFFSFISKEPGEKEKHTCFVFVSDKLAEEITLTIGQAFELAYKKFLGTSGKELETKKQVVALQNRISLLESENIQLKARLRDVSKIKGDQDVKAYMEKHQLRDICQVEVTTENSESNSINNSSGSEADGDNELICLEVTTTDKTNSSSEHLDGFTLDDLNDDDFNPRALNRDANEDMDFNPRADNNIIVVHNDKQLPPLQSPPSVSPHRDNSKNSNGLIREANLLFQQQQKSEHLFFGSFSKDSPFGSQNPFETPLSSSSSGGNDPFGMSSFKAEATTANFSKMNQPFANDWKVQTSALGLGNMSLDELDPLKK